MIQYRAQMLYLSRRPTLMLGYRKIEAIGPDLTSTRHRERMMARGRSFSTILCGVMRGWKANSWHARSTLSRLRTQPYLSHIVIQGPFAPRPATQRRVNKYAMPSPSSSNGMPSRHTPPSGSQKLPHHQKEVISEFSNRFHNSPQNMFPASLLFLQIFQESHTLVV